jgi:LAO/AO transport system ATPase
MPDLDALVRALTQGDRRALSRLLTLAGQGVPLPALPAPTHPSRVIAVTGSGGVGKSTLVGKLIELLRSQNLKVAVLACDPQSPLSGGALLGDRFRMPNRPDDDGVFIRSLAALSGRGAIAEHLPRLVQLLEIFAFDVVLIETVGAGQGDTAVHELADIVVLLVQPETGDDLQWEKAGVLEVADIVVVHKADLPGAEQTAAHLRASLDLPGARSVPVLCVSARTGTGLAELWQHITALTRRRDVQREERQELLRLAQAALLQRFEAAVRTNDSRLERLLQERRNGQLDDAAAGAVLLGLLQDINETSV